MDNATILKNKSRLVAILLEVKTEGLGFWEKERILIDVFSSVN